MVSLCSIYCGMPKGTSRAEVTSNSESIALAVVKLHLSEESVRQSVSRKFIKYIYIFYNSTQFLKSNSG